MERHGCWCGLSSWIIVRSTCHRYVSVLMWRLKRENLKPERVNPVSKTVLDRRGSTFTHRKTRKEKETSLKRIREHMKEERGERGEQALQGSREAGATCLPFDPSMRRTCCSVHSVCTTPTEAHFRHTAPKSQHLQHC